MIGTIEGKNSFTHSDIPEWMVGEIGRYTSIAADCYFHDNDNHYCIENKKYVSSYNFRAANQPRHIKIGNDVWIGRGAKILTGITIGDGAIIGAHSVVTKDVPPFAVVAGNPANIKRFRFNTKQMKKLLKIEWWHWPNEKVQTALEAGDFDDIDLFIKKYD